MPRMMPDERGYLMVALLVAMSIMAILMSAALPAWHTLMRREKEAELVFRGEQYARAIGLYQRRFANQPVPSIDVLVEQRFLRKKYKDPITNGDFQVVTSGASLPGQIQQSQQQLQQSVSQAQQAFQQAAGRAGGAAASPQGRGGSGFQLAGPGPAGGFQLGGAVTGGIVGVTSGSAEKSFRLYNGRDTYNQWIFMPTQQAARVGGPGGAPPGAAGRATGRGLLDGFGRQGSPAGRGGAPQGDGGRGGRGQQAQPARGAIR